jgi:hypothetical protein
MLCPYSVKRLKWDARGEGTPRGGCSSAAWQCAYRNHRRIPAGLTTRLGGRLRAQHAVPLLGKARGRQRKAGSSDPAFVFPRCPGLVLQSLGLLEELLEFVDQLGEFLHRRIHGSRRVHVHSGLLEQFDWVIG